MRTADRVKTFAVTALDTWRRWDEDEGDDDHAAPTIADLRERLLGRAQTHKMLAGFAGHQVLEELADGNTTSISEPGIEIRGFDMFDRALGLTPGSSALAASASTFVLVERNDGELVPVTLRWELPELERLVIPPLRESKVELEFATTVGVLRAKGRIDGGDGLEVLDYKFTGRPDLEELERSWQWKVYLCATGATRFRWEVFHVRQPLKGEDAYRIVSRQTYTQYAYPGMRAEVQRAVERFARIVDLHVPEYWDRNAHLEAPVESEEA